MKPMSRQAAAVLLWSLAALHSGQAAACEGSCNALFDVCWQGPTPNVCQAELARCLDRCRSGGAPARPLAPTVPWGYLVFDTATGKSGASWGFSSGIEARGAARAACKREGGVKCDWQMPARGGCVAVAQGENAQGRIAHQKSGGREALPIARSKAVDHCSKEGGRHCRVVAQACSWKL